MNHELYKGFDWNDLDGKTLKIIVGVDRGTADMTCRCVMGIDIETNKYYLLHTDYKQ